MSVEQPQMQERVAQIQRLEVVDHNYKKRRNMMLWGVLALFMMQTVSFWAIYQPQRASRASVDAGPLQAIGTTDLCPGDVLSYRFTMGVKEPTMVDIDSTVLRVSPPVTLIFESTRRAIFPSAMDVPVEQHWTIPLDYVNPATGEKEGWTAGAYLRLVAVTTPARSTWPTLSQLPFTIKECTND